MRVEIVVSQHFCKPELMSRKYTHIAHCLILLLLLQPFAVLAMSCCDKMEMQESQSMSHDHHAGHHNHHADPAAAGDNDAQHAGAGCCKDDCCCKGEGGCMQNCGATAVPVNPLLDKLDNIQTRPALETSFQMPAWPDTRLRPPNRA